MRYRQTVFWLVITLISAMGVTGYIANLKTKKSAPTELTNQVQLPETFQLSSVMVPGIYQFLATQSAIATQADRPVLAALVSHHLLAAPLINETIAAACQTTVATVVVVSPDHFGYLRREPPQILAGVSSFDWQTPQTFLPSNQELAIRLAKLPTVKVLENPVAVGTEHGIFAIIPFIEKWCSSPHITALIVRPQNQNKSLEVIGEQISTYAKESQRPLLVVISSDFTHEQSLVIANQLDTATKQELMRIGQQETPDFSKVTSDCPACLVVLHGHLANSGVTQLTNLKHQTSANYGGQSTSVTSYFGGIWQ